MTDLTHALVGSRLKKARHAAGITQKQVAGYLGISREMVSCFEKGSREIDMVRLTKLADLYGRSLTSFLAREDVGDKEASIRLRARDLRPEDVEAVAWAKKFARNLYSLNRLIADECSSDR